MKQLVRLFFALLPCLLLSCDYAPSGSHYEDINPNPEVVGGITLDPEQDTIQMRGTVFLNFNIKLPGRTVYGYRLMLNDKLLEEGSLLREQPLFQSKNYQNGYHKLQLSVLASSGTGSLGDKAGVEAVEVYKTWVLHIDNTPPKALAVTRVQPKEGSLKITWQKYTGTGFKEYVILRNFGPYLGGATTTITDQNKTSWTDPYYVGGEVSYTVILYINGMESGVHGPATAYHYPLPQILSSSYNAAHQLVVRISSTPFYNNFEKYELTVNGTEKTFSTGRKDTLFTLPTPHFGGDFVAMLHTHAKEPLFSHVPAFGTSATIGGLGTPWGPHAVESFFARPSSGLFYAYTPEVLKVIDAYTLQVKVSAT